jgi:hypothetical protein
MCQAVPDADYTLRRSDRPAVLVCSSTQLARRLASDHPEPAGAGHWPEAPTLVMAPSAVRGRTDSLMIHL